MLQSFTLNFQTILAKTNGTRRIIYEYSSLCPLPLAMLIPELRKHAMSLANSSANGLTPIYYSVQPTLSGGKGRGGSRIFCTLVEIFVAIKQGGITYFFRGEVGVICD